MNNNRYLLPAIAAIALAILFPIYWIGQFWAFSTEGSDAIHQDLQGLNVSDLVLLLTGILNVYVYMSLKKFLNERHAFGAADIPLLLLIATVSVFVFGSLIMDTIMHYFGNQLNFSWHIGALEGNTGALIISTIVFGILDIILGIILFTQAREFSSILKAFAIIMIVQGVFEVTVVFSPITFIIFPVALILLAILFIRDPEILEVV